MVGHHRSIAEPSRRPISTPIRATTSLLHRPDGRTRWASRRDLRPGQQIVECLKPFLLHLLDAGLSRTTLRRHRDNLWLLGGGTHHRLER